MKNNLYLCGFFLVFVLSVKSSAADSSTLYTGYLEIELTSFSDIKAQLKKHGCKADNNQLGQCSYTVKLSTCGMGMEQGIAVYPGGRVGCFGLCGFCLTEKKLWASGEISGKPDIEKYQDWVRKILGSVGLVIKIKENSWGLISTKYPHYVLY